MVEGQNHLLQVFLQPPQVSHAWGGEREMRNENMNEYEYEYEWLSRSKFAFLKEPLKDPTAKLFPSVYLHHLV